MNVRQNAFKRSCSAANADKEFSLTNIDIFERQSISCAAERDDVIVRAGGIVMSDSAVRKNIN